MKDFTLSIYKELINAIAINQYEFKPFNQFIESSQKKTVCLRHDVDLLPYNSLAFAKIQADKNIKGTYYFRAVKESWNEKVIKEIFEMGHEIGYHYECLTTTNGDLKAGIKDFQKNLTDLRKLAPVNTICMHGSPMSKYDSKDLWKAYDYRQFGIVAEPYFDVDFKMVFYLTDTGRRWDGDKVSVRDRVDSGFNLNFHSTSDIISALNKNILPKTVMFTFHPQRWNDSIYMWTKELCIQNAKNQIKRIFFVKKR